MRDGNQAAGLGARREPSRLTATQPRLQASTPVTRIPLPSHTGFLRCLSGEAIGAAGRQPLGFPCGRGHFRRHRGTGGVLPAAPVLLRCTAPDALSNLVAVLELSADHQMRCSAATRRPLAATVRLVEDVLVGGDYYDGDRAEPIAAFAWPLLLQAGGLAQLAGTRLELTARGQAVLARPSYQALGALWDQVADERLARRAGPGRGDQGTAKPSTLTSVPKRRAAVAAGLAALQPGAWTDIDVLLGILATQRAPLVAARGLRALWRLYLADSYYGSLGHAGRRPGTCSKGGTRSACCSSTRPPWA